MPTALFNPIAITIRLFALAGVAVASYGVWELGRGAVTSPPKALTLNLAFGLLAAVILLILMAFAGYGAYRPTRAHLGVLLFLGSAFAGISAHTHLLGFIDTLFVKEVAGAIGYAAGWLIAALVFFLFIASEWWFAKKSGFVAPHRRWWSASNIRGVCVFTAWIAFFGLTNLVFDSEIVDRYIRPSQQANWELFGFVGLVALCVLHGKVTPRILIKLTGVEDSPLHKEETKRRFRIY